MGSLVSLGDLLVIYPLTVVDSQSLTISSARRNCSSNAVKMGEWSILVTQRDTIDLSNEDVCINLTCSNDLLDKLSAINSSPT
jgi:hypothetical protein